MSRTATTTVTLAGNRYQAYPVGSILHVEGQLMRVTGKPDGNAYPVTVLRWSRPRRWLYNRINRAARWVRMYCPW